jgi:hypothetical protein
MFIIKFMNGHVTSLPDIYQEDVFDYIIANGESVGIDSTDLLFHEQINISVQDEIAYVMIDNLESIYFYDVMTWIELRENKRDMLERYFQYLADHRRIELFATSRYCEVWYKPYFTKTYDTHEKISSLWKLYDEIIYEDTDKEGYLLCRNIPLSISSRRYDTINVVFNAEDVE